VRHLLKLAVGLICLVLLIKALFDRIETRGKDEKS